MSIASEIKTKAGVVALGGAVGLVAALAHTPAKSLPELARALGADAHAYVDADDVHWDPAGGALSDMLWGRYVTFLGAQTRGAPRDVYRARVRVSYEGVPYTVVESRNITQTALGDDHNLVARGAFAAYATFAFGQEQGVTLLDLRGMGARNTAVTPADRAMAYLTNVQQTGAGEGVGRNNVTFDEPIEKLWLTASEKSPSEVQFDITVARGRLVSTHVLDAASGAITGDAVHAEAQRQIPKRPILWAVDTVRAIPWVGPAPIAWLEEKTFALKDSAKKLAFEVTGKKDEVVIAAERPVPTLDTSQASLDTGHWPPPRIKSMWKTPEPGEGEWVVPDEPWLKRMPAQLGETPPAPFMRTFVRTDEARQYSKVLLVAMDTRQLDLDMEAGVEDPKPLTGPPGSGRVPRDPKIFTRIAATFNGGFKTEHGSYGMMIKKRVLLPPVAGAASIVVLQGGAIGLGSWGNTTKVTGIKGVQDASILSFRQNLEALVEDGVVNPGGRTQWGFTLPDSGMQTERSGVCVTQAGHLLYAWGDDVSGITLGKAMQMAGCSYGVHLDMNPHHTGLSFTNITDIKSKNYKAQLLTKQMEIAADRYIEYAPKDFFYLLMRESGPPATGSLAWSPDTGTQPAPRWMPALWRAKAAEVDLFAAEPGRVSFRLRAGTAEAHVAEPAQTELAEAERTRVLAGITFGAAPEQRALGLTIDGKPVVAANAASYLRALITEADGTISIKPAAALAQLAPNADAVEVPVLLEAGELVRGNASAEFALGITAEGRAIFARQRGGGNAGLGAALKAAGAQEAVLLTRSINLASGGELMRSGTALQPSLHYRETSLSIIGFPMRPRGFRFVPETPVEPKKKR